MQLRRLVSAVLLMITLTGLLPLQALDKDEKPSTTSESVKMTVTARVLGENKRMPNISREDVIVTQGKDRLRVTNWVPARGLDLFILIDESSDTSLGSYLDELRSFIVSQPSKTSVGVGYMRNGTVYMAQNFTNDLSKAANAVRLPLGSSGAFGSPYLSVIDLMKRWPENSNRREVVMVTDGIDRLRGGPWRRGLGFISPDVDSASTVAQRTGTIVNTIFARGVGRRGNNFWEITNGQNGMAKLADETGGESFFLGTQNAVSFRPYLDSLQKSFENRYVLEFQPLPGKKPGLKPVTLTTEIAGVELDSADSVWVNAR